MSKYTPEQLEQMFADMRLRQQQLREAERGTPRVSRTAYRIRERQKREGMSADMDFLRVNEVAELLHVHPTTVSRWFRSRAVKAGESGKGPQNRKRTLLISRKMLEDWVRERSA